MTEAEAKTVSATMVQLIERRICEKGWLYWPPGPMAGQVFDRAACQRDVEKLVAEIVRTAGE